MKNYYTLQCPDHIFCVCCVMGFVNRSQQQAKQHLDKCIPNIIKFYQTLQIWSVWKCTNILHCRFLSSQIEINCITEFF